MIKKAFGGIVQTVGFLVGGGLFVAMLAGMG